MRSGTAGVLRILTFVLLARSGFPQASAPATIAGRVVDSDNNQPINGAVVIAMPEQANPAAALSIDPIGIKTGADGRFSIPLTLSGPIRIHCEKAGFETLSRTIAPPARGQTQDSNGQAEIELRMAAQAIVTGRVTGPDGAPLANATVRLSQMRLDGWRTVLSVVKQVLTDDLGQYRMFDIAPGRYYISTSYQDTAGALGLRQRSSNGALVTEDYGVTYYPSVPNPENASPVRLRSRQVTSGIDMRVEMERSFSVSGKVGGLPPGAPPLQIFLQPLDTASPSAPRYSVTRGPDAQFRFKSIPPGTYVLMTAANMNGQLYRGREVAQVSSDLANLSIELQPPFSMAGSAIMEDGSRPKPDVRLRVDGFNSGFRAEVKVGPDGRFEAPNAVPDKYVVTAADKDGKTFIKSILLDGRQAETKLIPVSDSNHSLHIVVSKRAAQITGTTDSGQRSPGGGLAVLIGTDLNDLRIHATQIDPAGSFTFKSLMPGHYRILCFSDLSREEDVTWDVQRKIKTQGQEIDLKEDEDKKLKIELVQIDSM